MQSPPGAVTRIDGREYLYFVGTGYLGLQGRPEVIRAACEAAQRYGIGSANSRTAFGTTPPLLEVERLAAAMFGLDDAFYFASGWLGNHVLMQLLDAQSGLILLDEYSHYSVFEAARASGYPHVTFRHRDPDDLQAKLKECLKPSQSAVVLSDGVFAATGRIAPAREYHDILREYPGSMLCLDDAHGLAVLGENGRGTFEHTGLWSHGVNVTQCTHHAPRDEIRDGSCNEIHHPPCDDRHHAERDEYNGCPSLFLSGTLSKAVGGFGGIIPGNGEFIRRVKLRVPHFGGASPPPAPIAAATARAIEIVMAEPELRTRLGSNARLLKDGLRKMGLDTEDTPVPIVGLTLGTADNMRRIQGKLMDCGIAIAYMPTYSGLGPEGALRIAVFATHTDAMIGQLLDELRRLV